MFETLSSWNMYVREVFFGESEILLSFEDGSLCSISIFFNINSHRVITYFIQEK